MPGYKSDCSKGAPISSVRLSATIPRAFRAFLREDRKYCGKNITETEYCPFSVDENIDKTYRRNYSSFTSLGSTTTHFRYTKSLPIWASLPFDNSTPDKQRVSSWMEQRSENTTQQTRADFVINNMLIFLTNSLACKIANENALIFHVSCSRTEWIQFWGIQSTSPTSKTSPEPLKWRPIIPPLKHQLTNYTLHFDLTIFAKSDNHYERHWKIDCQRDRDKPMVFNKLRGWENPTPLNHTAIDEETINLKFSAFSWNCELCKSILWEIFKFECIVYQIISKIKHDVFTFWSSMIQKLATNCINLGYEKLPHFQKQEDW
jgi:hypothetical protein